MPFYTIFLGFLFAPTGSPVSHLATVDHQHSQRTGSTLGHALQRRTLIAFLRLLLGLLSNPLHQRMQRRIINASSPFAGHLRCLLIRTGGGDRKAELLGEAGGNLLMRTQLPRSKQRTPPLTRDRVLAVINGQFYVAQFASQGEGSSPTLPEGEKPRRFPRLVFAGAPPVAGGPIRGLPPQPHVQCQPDGETA